MTRKECLQEANRHIELINRALAWGEHHRGDNFPSKRFREWRRRLKRMRDSMTEKCSAAAYGQSQVGKSYLISSLLSSPTKPFTLKGPGREYDFKTEVNSSASTNAEVEATGIVTRFTLQPQGENASGRIRIRNLSVPDIILMLTDSYYNDIKIDSDNELDSNDINLALDRIFESGIDTSVNYGILEEDDILNIGDYIVENLPGKAYAIRNSRFIDRVAPIISHVPTDKWVDIFGLLWNRNPELNKLFSTLISAYDRLGFRQHIEVPFDAVLWEKGTLLKVQWLDTVCASDVDMGNDEPTVDVFDSAGNLIAPSFPKGELSALIAELTFGISPEYARERGFFNKLDLLDFPGARSREGIRESELSTVIPKILRRGKVAYLFNKYSREGKISSVLFCHHDNQKGVGGDLGDTITQWIENNIGKDPAERKRMISTTHGISPFFFVATKFNRDLEKLATDSPARLSELENHWERFNKVIPEIIEPATWLDRWEESPSGSVLPFRNFFPLRDFEHSKKGGLFIGYEGGNMSRPEQSEAFYADFP